MHHDILSSGLLLLAMAVLAVIFVRRVQLPPVLGYLIVGLITGPHALAWLPDLEELELLAEIGVIFLLFMIGLEFSLPQFMALRHKVLGVGGSQVALSTGFAALIAWMAGMDWAAAFVIGGTLALSSTAIVVKQLIEQLEMQSRHGRMAFAVLLFQDIAVVPFLVLIPILAQGGEGSVLVPVLLALLKAVIAVVGLLALGHWLIRPLFHVVAGAHSAELFTLTTLLVALSAAWMTSQFGLSLALGAFLGGMMLSETEFRHQIEHDVRPFRDILMGVFFISVGAQLDLHAVWAHLWAVLAISLGITAGKFLLVALLVRGLGYEPAVSVRSGLVLANGGEFGFALLTLALAQGVISSAAAQLILAAIVFSMMVAPLLVRFNGPIAQWLFPESYGEERNIHRQRLDEVAAPLREHVVFCGFGRIGQNLAGFLKQEGIPYLAMDLDPRLVKEAWEAGEPVFYGDATHFEMLRTAGIERARMVLITLDDVHAAETVLLQIRQHYAELPVLVRTRDDARMDDLEEKGADLVLPETLEASMMLSHHMLEFLGVDGQRIQDLIAAARSDHYHQLRGYFHGDVAETLEESELPRLHSISLSPEDAAVGQTLEQLQLARCNVQIAAVCRDGVRGDAPDPKMQLLADDVVIVEGSAEAVEHAEQVLHRG